MRLAWERIAAVLFSGAAWLMILVGAPHAAHALRMAPRQLAHAVAARGRQLG